MIPGLRIFIKASLRVEECRWCFCGFKRIKKKKEIMEQRGTKCYLVEEARREETIRCGEMLIMRLQQDMLTSRSFPWA